MDPTYRPSLRTELDKISGALPVAGSDFVLSPSDWSSRVVGKVSSWIDLDGSNEVLRRDSETTLKQEIAWASHLSVQEFASFNQLSRALVWGANSLGRWFGEPVRAAIIDANVAFFNHIFQAFHEPPKESLDSGIKRHPLRSYLDYVGFLYQRMEPLPEQERFEYQRAISKALLDRVSDDQLSSETCVLMVVGAGRCPLVRATLQATEETSRLLRVYAVEKNPNAVVTLHSLIKLECWEDIVTIVSSDMCCWDAPERADVLVSKLLGSFGDNELSPECLDGAQRFLKPDGVSIPSSYVSVSLMYTSFLQPITASKFYNDVKSHNDLMHFETAYVVKMHSIARLAPCQPFLPGFAGYFDATLYKDVHLGMEPTMATPNMFSWFPIYFPLRSSVQVEGGRPLEVHIWRCCGPTKVWYEWCVASPTASPIHNSNGRSYWVGL
ncbi:hypothetical protein Drorol1_Dr00017807 [Drosera rotundifolia]